MEIAVGLKRNEGDLMAFTEVSGQETSELQVTWDASTKHGFSTYVALRCWNGANRSRFAYPPAIYKVDATPPKCITKLDGRPLPLLGEGKWLAQYELRAQSETFELRVAHFNQVVAEDRMSSTTAADSIEYCCRVLLQLTDDCCCVPTFCC